MSFGCTKCFDTRADNENIVGLLCSYLPTKIDCLKKQIQEEILLQVNLIITLSLGSMETDRVISEPCYNEVIYNRYITK